MTTTTTTTTPTAAGLSFLESLVLASVTIAVSTIALAALWSR